MIILSVMLRPLAILALLTICVSAEPPEALRDAVAATSALRTTTRVQDRQAVLDLTYDAKPPKPVAIVEVSDMSQRQRRFPKRAYRFPAPKPRFRMPALNPPPPGLGVVGTMKKTVAGSFAGWRAAIAGAAQVSFGGRTLVRSLASL